MNSRLTSAPKKPSLRTLGGRQDPEEPGGVLVLWQEELLTRRRENQKKKKEEGGKRYIHQGGTKKRPGLWQGLIPRERGKVPCDSGGPGSVEGRPFAYQKEWGEFRSYGRRQTDTENS